MLTHAPSINNWPCHEVLVAFSAWVAVGQLVLVPRLKLLWVPAVATMMVIPNYTHCLWRDKMKVTFKEVEQWSGWWWCKLFIDLLIGEVLHAAGVNLIQSSPTFLQSNNINFYLYSKNWYPFCWQDVFYTQFSGIRFVPVEHWCVPTSGWFASARRSKLSDQGLSDGGRLLESDWKATIGIRLRIASHLVVEEVRESHGVLLPSFGDIRVATNSE